MKLKYLLLILVILLPCSSLIAVEGEVIKFELLIGKIDNLNIEAALKVKIQPGWHIYYKNPGDFGLPTILNWDDKLSNVDVHWPKPKQHRDEIGESVFTSQIYEDLVVFPIVAKLTQNSEDVEFTLIIDYAVCKEICISKKEKIKVKTKLNNFINNDISSLINNWRSR